MQSVLIVDDEPNIRRMVGALLAAEGYEVREAANGSAALRALEEDEPDIVLLDLMMPGELDGTAALSRIRQRWSELPVIMMSGRASLSDAVRATKLGAVNFLEKPLAPETVLLALGSALELRQAKRAARALRAELGRTGDMVGGGAAMARVREVIARVAPSDARVLITGESGTGKELVAAAIHEQSPRRERPFVRVNCAAIPRDLVESEMFGHEKGAFTGAAERRIGRFELADTGTLFLDEIGDLTVEAQAKLLRAIEAKEIQRVGGNKTIRADVRVVAATNRDLGEAVADGSFREDLYFRINVIPVQLPALRERGDDIVQLVQHFSAVQHERTGRPALTWSDEALARMRAYPWPGNVRELANIVERIAILTYDAHVTAADVASLLPDARDSNAHGAPHAVAERSLTDTLDEAERRLIADALTWASGNIAEAARRLKTDRANLYRRMKRLGMSAASILLAVAFGIAAILNPHVASAQGDTAATRRDTVSDSAVSSDSSALRVARDALAKASIAALYDSAGPNETSIHLGPSVSSGKTYNRVEGLSVLFGPELTIESAKISVDAEADAVLRTGRGLRTSEPDAGHNVRLATRFGPDHAFGLTGRLYDLIAPMQRWQLSEPEQALAAFLIRRDYLDYYEKHGGGVEASWAINEKATVSAGYARERWSSIDARNPFTLFHENGRWRPNPEVDEGVFDLYTIRSVFDTRNDEREPSGGWFLIANYEYGASPSVLRASRVQNPAPATTTSTPERVRYGRVFFDLRRYNRISPRTELDARVVGGGWVSGDELPLERKLSVSGPGVLPGYDFRERVGSTDVLQCTGPDVAPLSNPVDCDRVVVGQLEFRTELASHPFHVFNTPALRLRSIGFTTRPVGVLFSDIGRGWRTTEPWPGRYKADIGAGLDLGLAGIYAAKAVTDWSEPVNFFLRIRRRF